MSTRIRRTVAFTAAITTAALGTLCCPPAALAQTAIADSDNQARQSDSFALEEVVITAQKRPENLQKAALSVVAIKGDDIVSEGKTNLAQILNATPNVSMQGGLSQGSFFFIRGVGNNPVFGQDASVTFTTNGVFNQRGNSIRGSYYDIDRVEVSRGPQNVYVGRSAEGGSINVIPNEPQLGKLDLSGSAEAGSNSLVAGQTMINLPINDVLALRTAVTTVNRNGFNADGTYDEATTAGRSRLLFQPTDTFKAIITGAYTHVGGKGDAQAITGPIDDSHSLSFPNGYFWNTNPPDTNQNYTVRDLYADVTWTTPWTTVYFQPTWQHSDLIINGWSSSYCCGPTSYVSSLAAGFTPAVAYDRSVSLQRNNSYQTQRSFELRFSSPEDSTIKWMGGAYYYRNYQPINVVVFNGGSVLPAGATPGNSNQVGIWPDLRNPGIYPESNRRLEVSKDVYGQFTVPFTPATRFTGGLRYSQITKSRNVGLGYFLEPDGNVINSLGNGVPFNDNVGGSTAPGVNTGARKIPINDFVVNYADASVNFSRVNWKAVIEHDLATNKMIYGGVTTGWKSGSFINLPSPSDVCPNDRPVGTTTNLGDCYTTTPAGTTYLAPGFTNVYKPEYLTSFEVGSKNQFLDDRLRLNAAAYYYNYRNYQFNVNLPVWNPDTGADPDATATTTLNAQKVKDYGAELESSFLMTPVDRLEVNAAYLHAVFDSVVIPPAPSAAAAVAPAYLSAVQWAAGLHGFPLPHSPKFTFTPSYAHIFGLKGGANVTATLDANYSSSYVLTLPGNASLPSGFSTGAALLNDPWLYTQPAFWKLDVSLAYTSASGKWGLSAYLHNATNRMTLEQLTVPTAVTGTVNPVNQAVAGVQNVSFQADEPRTFGIVVHAQL